MEIHSFNKELILANLQFKRIFNNISIDKDGKNIPFTCILEDRSRILKNLENPQKNGQYNLPIISIRRTGILKNDSRLTNINNEIKYATTYDRLNYNLLTPVPIDISYEVSIISKMKSHIDRAISNFIPFFNKDLFVQLEHPKFEGIIMKNQVIMDDSITEDHPVDLDTSMDDIIVCTCNFIYKTWMFCGNDRAYRRYSNNGPNYTGKTPDISSSQNGDSDETSIVPKVSVDETTGESVIVDVEYNGFIPVIHNINVGFYPVPLLSDYVAHMDYVDSLSEQNISERPYVDRFNWKIDETYGLREEDNWYHTEIEEYDN